MSADAPDSTLFAVLRSHPAGHWVDAAPAGARPARLAEEFAQAGWLGVQLAVSESGADIDALLAAAGVRQAQWMTVRGDAALRALAGWQGAACRPLAVLADAGPLALSAAAAPAPAWRDSLQRNGYLFAVSDDGYHHFVRGDEPALHAQLAERASLAWRGRLQASRNALAQAERQAEQARSALLMAQAKGMAAEARATMLEQQIAAIYASSSWRSTKPLRWGARLRQDPGPALRQLRAVLRLRLAASLRKVQARVEAKVEANPRLRSRGAALAARYPALARRLDALLRAAAPPADPMAPALPPAIDPNNMTGPQFKTLLLAELGRGLPPASGQG